MERNLAPAFSEPAFFCQKILEINMKNNIICLEKIGEV